MVLKRGVRTLALVACLKERKCEAAGRAGSGLVVMVDIKLMANTFTTKADGSIGSSDVILRARSSLHKTTSSRNAYIRNSHIRIQTLIEIKIKLTYLPQNVFYSEATHLPDLPERSYSCPKDFLNSF